MATTDKRFMRALNGHFNAENETNFKVSFSPYLSSIIKKDNNPNHQRKHNCFEKPHDYIQLPSSSKYEALFRAHRNHSWSDE